MLAVSMPKYPLEPLVALREKKVDEATSELAAAMRRHEAAARVLRTAEARREAQARVVAELRAAELEALSQGELRARDLARGDAWGSRVAVERETLVANVERAGAAEVEARQDERKAQAGVATRRADARVVEGHRERWDTERRKVVEAREEEASAEAWRPKR
jgi:hypothetical protein